jgi:hypothetical protein
MKLSILTIAVALATLAACDRNPEPRASATPPPAGAGTTAPAASQSNTPSTPANIGQPGSQEEKKDGANPVQGQVDPKQGEQHKDFQQRGDGAGPRGPDTEPKSAKSGG